MRTWAGVTHNGLVHLTGLRVSTAIVQIGVLFVVSRICGADTLAVYGVLIALAYTATAVLDGGLGCMALRGLPRSSHSHAYAYAGLNLPRLALLAGGTISVGAVGVVLYGPRGFIPAALLAVATAAQQLGRNTLIGRGYAQAEARYTFVESLLVLGVTAIIAVSSASPFLLAVGLAMSYLVGALIRFVAGSRLSRTEHAPHPPVSLQESLPYGFQALASAVLIRADVLVLAFMSAPLLPLAVYQVSSRLYYLLPLPFEAYASMLIGRYAVHRESASSEDVTVTWDAQVWAAAGMALLLVPATKVLLVLSGLPSGQGWWFWAALSAACMFRLLSYTPGALLTLSGQQSYRTRNSLSVAALDLVLVVLLYAVTHEPTTAAIALAFAELMLVWRTSRRAGLPQRGLVLVLPVAAASAVLACGF